MYIRGSAENSSVDKDTLMEHNQMRFIFQHSPTGSSHTFSIGVAVFGSQWLKMSSTIDMISAYKLFSLSFYKPTKREVGWFV